VPSMDADSAPSTVKPLGHSKQDTNEPINSKVRTSSSTVGSRLPILPSAPLIVSGVQLQNLMQEIAGEIPTLLGAISEVLGRLPKLTAATEFAKSSRTTEQNENQIEPTLRFYDQDIDGRNEFPACPDWSFFGDPHIIALLDAHVMFARECLNSLKHAAKAPVIPSPPEVASHVPLSPKCSEDVPFSPSCTDSTLFSSALLRPVRFFFFFLAFSI